MGDYAKKPKNYRRGRCLEFERICREEREAGATVVIVKPCSADGLPCLANIEVLGGVAQPCAACAPNVQRMRDLHGFKQEGAFWMSDGITPGQQQMLRRKIELAEAEEAADQLAAHEALYGREDRERELARHGDECDCDTCEANREALRDL